MKVDTQCELVLASGSPRRAELLRLLGVEFSVRHADIDETPRPGEPPGELTLRLALEKALAVGRSAGQAAVLGGDTSVAIDDHILGKPADRRAAEEMLGRLSGRSHRVYTAVAIVKGADRRSLLSTSHVNFAELSAREIEEYCATGEPLDKAGAYGIQGRAGAFVRRVDGSCSGIVGLPLWETRRLLLETGIIVEAGKEVFQPRINVD
ncbi:MAG: Maf family protein [Pseudomonadota bacterium]|nr:Maf family protein [Pseudomonadota bacterium]